MIYLDYSATTPVDKNVLESFNKANLEFIGNANSKHNLGLNINKLITSATIQIKDLLNIRDKEVIYTSSSSESNNMAIKGIALKYKNRGKHIITTYFEHSSVNEPLKYLEDEGFEISFVKTDEFGIIDLKNLKELIRNDTILVIVNAINSELGIKQPIEEIGLLLKDYPKTFYHVDLTQAIGKINLDLTNVDMACFSAHKIYGLKGIACLIKNNNINLEPLIHGGQSTTIYRSGTPAHPLIVSLSKALRLSMESLNEKYKYVQTLNDYLKVKLSIYKDVYINSNEKCIPHILNISINGIKAETFLHALESYEVYVSTKSACSDETSLSETVLQLIKDKERASSSIRISLSHLTTKEEIDQLILIFEKCYNKLKFKKD